MSTPNITYLIEEFFLTFNAQASDQVWAKQSKHFQEF